MSDRLCTCCPHLPVRSEKLNSFYNENFVPLGWKLSYTTLSGGVSLYLTGYCQDCRNDLEEWILITDKLSGDELLSTIYETMWETYPYDKKLDAVGYYGLCKARSAFYHGRDRWGTFRRGLEFLRLFHDYDREQARLWLEKFHPERTCAQAFRDTGGSLFCAAMKLAEENRDLEKARPILDYVLPCEHEDFSCEHTELTVFEFDFVPIVNYGSEGICLDCYLRGKFDESGRHMLRMGTLKTLERSLEAAKTMAELGGVLFYHAGRYVNKNLHRYTPQSELDQEYRRMLEKEKRDDYEG